MKAIRNATRAQRDKAAAGSRAGEHDRNMAPLAGSSVVLDWRDPGQPPFRLAGLPWFAQDRVYRRLPLCPPEPIREAVSELANCPAGAQVAFQTDSTQLAVQVELTGPAYMNHMPATGQCGIDLYLGRPQAQRYYNTARYDIRETRYEVELFAQPVAKLRTVTLNLPLYQGVKRLRIGLRPGALVRPPPPWSDARPIVIYGTSITQGGCASRPGLLYSNIISRALNREVINLGFSGNGCGEPEVIQLMAAIPDPGLLVLDYEANAGPYETYRQTLQAAIARLRVAHPTVPLLVLSRIPFASEFTHAVGCAARQKRCRMQRDLVACLRRQGDRHLHFFDGANLLGTDADECTVDGVHPNDLGFMRMARGLTPVLHKLAKRARRTA